LASRNRAIISDGLIEDIADRLRRGAPVRRSLPAGGRVHIDRQLPFLVLYRPPEEGGDVGTARFVKGEASYLVAPRHRKHRRQVSALVTAIASSMTEVFGGFMLIEFWSGPDDAAATNADGAPQPPGFRVVTARRDADSPSVVRLVNRLRRISVLGSDAEVELAPGGRLSPPEQSRISRSLGTATSDVRLIGIEIRPIYRNAVTGEELPVVGRALHRQFSRALQQAVYEFAHQQTTHRPLHYQALGRRAFVKAASQVDGELAAIGSTFDLLLLVTPVNTDQAYRAFRRSTFDEAPQFEYRYLDVDPPALKRALYRVPIERVEDPTLEAIFREKQRELSIQLDLLSDRGTPRFLHGGLSLYGDVESSMIATARDVLQRVEPRDRQRQSRMLGAPEFAERASAEIDSYRQVYPDLGAKVELRDDVTSLMVSQGNLLVGSAMRFAEDRVQPLLQHEIGTHVVTFWNGAAQRFRLLASGLAGYDELQEGLAVLAEYLVAGLTGQRLRTLAARVLAAGAVRDGSEFVETFRLISEHGFSNRNAFLIATRVHRGGGFVKDAVYLRGLQRVAAHLGDGGRLDTLLVGKISVGQAPVIEELQRRGVVVAPPLRPRYLDEPDAHYRLERLRGNPDLVALAEPR
jgi:uncharacterized protein (TIGR02421 family)